MRFSGKKNRIPSEHKQIETPEGVSFCARRRRDSRRWLSHLSGRAPKNDPPDRFTGFADGGIRSGASPLSRPAPKNDPPDRFTGFAVGAVRIPPSTNKNEAPNGVSFCSRRRRDSNPRDPEVKRISSAPRYDRFDTSACIVPDTVFDAGTFILSFDDFPILPNLLSVLQ